MLTYVRALAWPAVTIILLIGYRRVIESLLPGTKVKLTLAGVTIETTLDVVAKSLEEAVDDEGSCR